ncbi:MAG: HAD hydrolase family protein [Gemmatimonadales bacterium]|nr:HAD hydrolase family protein [Gemmatimonadales bacterium]
MPDLARAARIRLLVLDVDGVLTDNGIYLGVVDGRRVEFKRFDIQDGLGLALLRGTGVEVAWLSARPSEATVLRAEELRIPTCIQDPRGRKLPVLTGLLADRGLTWEEVGFVGDDLADLAVLKRVGWAVAVANATAEVKAVAHWVTEAAGGHGAVREVVETLLRARGEYDTALARYLDDRDDAA